MRKVCVGIHVHAEPSRLRATLESVRARTPGGVGLLLLPDGPDAETAEALASMPGVEQSGTDAGRGAAACFNRLASASPADVLVLVESGAVVGPGWLDYLLAALDADASHGLAGPSTNNAWNEQGAFPRAGGTVEEVGRAAREAARRFAGEVRALAPLHSLADFCYAVRREVVEAVGAADEAYGAGPCWEMDYNARAARAGFKGVWACSAYVWRAPFTARRREEERRLFEINKRRYQDKFCGARLRGEKTDYRRHCRGDACPNFAPPESIRIHLPLRARGPKAPTPAPPELRRAAHAAPPAPHAVPDAARTPPAPAHVPRAAASDVPDAAHALSPGAHAPLPEARPALANAPRVNAGVPLVTCIMPTGDRRAFVPQAVRCFLAQDYPDAELLVLDDGADAVADLLPADARVRYVRLAEKLSVGAKRNLACEQARGSLIVHWDDDDWYPPWRVRVQVRALTEGGADLCGTSQLFYYEAASGRAWRYAYAGSRGAWVAGNTLAYRRDFWRRHRFPDVRVGEDTRFVWGAAGAKVSDLADPSLCVATVHAANTSPKNTGGGFWHELPPEEVRRLVGDDFHLYRTASLAAAGADDWPLVSCIMPTYDRRAYVPLALEHFRRQDYPRKELIVVDDGADAVGDLCEGRAGVRYVRLAMHTSIGGKRNLACRQARGQVIAHWDDDDWYAPDRLRYQVAPILAGEADLTGLVNNCVLELPGGDFWTTTPDLHPRMFVGDVHGGTLVFRASLLETGIRYPETSLAEDAALIRQAVARRGRLLRLSNPGLFVYVRHGANAWREYAPGRFIDPDGWRRIPQPATFPAASLAAYRTASRKR
ncbi:MAG TPA: glycosyltransferase [Pyrinomonadaceae bacterium]|nr:glycosyltransferase [Pyrinomonadaceae bacterium]